MHSLLEPQPLAWRNLYASAYPGAGVTTPFSSFTPAWSPGALIGETTLRAILYPSLRYVSQSSTLKLSLNLSQANTSAEGSHSLMMNCRSLVSYRNSMNHVPQ